MQALKNIVSRLLIPLLTLNLAGLAAAALWLVSYSQWQVIWIGFMMLLFSSNIIPLFLIPAGVFSHFMNLYRAAQRPQKEKTMFFLSVAYILLFLTFWCTGIFEYVTYSVLPRAAGAGVLWACTAALTPLLWWSSRDRDNIFIMLMVEGAQLAMIAVVAARLLAGVTSFWTYFAVFGTVMAAIAATQAVYEKNFMNKAEAEKPR